MGKTGNNYFNANTWIEFSGDHGLYYPNNYNYHVNLDNQYLRLRNNSTTNGIRVDTSNGTTRGYFYADHNNNIGLLDNNGSWSFRTQRGSNSCTLYDQHFYTDTNDTYNLGSTSARWKRVYAKYLHAGHSSRYIGPITGSYGTIQVNGAGAGNWQGYSIAGRAVLMHDGGSETGLYNDVDNQWMINCHGTGSVRLYYNGSQRFYTTSSGALVTGSLTVGQSSASDIYMHRFR